MAIKVTKIVEPVPIRGFGIFSKMIMVCLCITIIGIPLAVAYAMVASIFVNVKNTQVQNKFIVDGVELFRKFIGQEVEHLNVGVDVSDKVYSLSGIAYKDGYFYLMHQGSATRVPPDMIRDYSWNIDGVTKHYVIGAGPLSGSGATIRALDQASALQAYKNSGLTINVKDVAHPTWFVMTNSRTLCEKWTEIFKQVEARTM